LKALVLLIIQTVFVPFWLFENINWLVISALRQLLYK